MTAIVYPIIAKGSPRITGPVVMAATRPDFRDLAEPLGLAGRRPVSLYTSHLLLSGEEDGPCLVGPMVGAPYAVMVLETLIAWGARSFLFLGWCGAISPDVGIGDIVLPEQAAIEEGTSAHYGAREETVDRPSGPLAGRIAERLDAADLCWHAGRVWTTDAIYRETPEAVTRHQRRGVLAVEMETSALFTVAACRGVELASLLVVSDELASLTWRPGFRDSRFSRARKAVAAIAGHLLKPTDAESP